MRYVTRSFIALLLCLVSGCGAGAAAEARHEAYTEARAGRVDKAVASYQRTRDRALLGEIAAGLLEGDLLSNDARRERAAFSELAAAGSRAKPLLQRLNVDSTSARVRVQVLAALAALGDDLAREELRALHTVDDPELADVAYQALDPARDRDVLLLALSSPRTDRRLAALHALAAAAVDPGLLRALAERARLDPTPAVRIAALDALQGQGAAAAEVVVQSLDEPLEELRLEAIAVLVRIDLARAERELSRWLGGPTTPGSIEAARALLAAHSEHEATRAARVLSLALAAPSVALRGRAASAQRALPAAQRDVIALRERLATETVPEVRLLLALALPAADPLARATLTSLSKNPSVPGVQAALELARVGDQPALQLLRGCLASPSADVRRSAARALGRDLQQPDAIALLLLDADASVRRATAGALLRDD